MPTRPKAKCSMPGCPNRAIAHGRCAFHPRGDDLGQARRLSAARRGYGPEWKKIRETVLAQHGIPKEEWPLYDVDHYPAYDASVEPDHHKYTLTPVLHGEHSRKTVLVDGGFGNKVR